VGRFGERLGSHVAMSPSFDDDADAGESPAAQMSAQLRSWQAKLEPSRLEWLERFIEETLGGIAEERIRAVALDLVSHAQTPVSTRDPKDPNTLIARFAVSRQTIYKWQDAARALLYDALKEQDECEIDMSVIKIVKRGRNERRN
jgi:hypothetical protein